MKALLACVAMAVSSCATPSIPAPYEVAQVIGQQPGDPNPEWAIYSGNSKVASFDHRPSAKEQARAIELWSDGQP